MDKRVKDKLVRSSRENGGGQDAQKDLHSRTGRDEQNGKTQERMERGSRKRSSSAGSEKMERIDGRQEKMEGHCSTGQSPQQAVVPMEEEVSTLFSINLFIYIQQCCQYLVLHSIKLTDQEITQRKRCTMMQSWATMTYYSTI